VEYIFQDVEYIFQGLKYKFQSLKQNLFKAQKKIVPLLGNRIFSTLAPSEATARNNYSLT